MRRIGIAVILLSFTLGGCAQVAPMGPLRVLKANPRYFTADGKKAIYLTGSHTWGNFQEYYGDGNPPPPFDYAGYLEFLKKHDHNFMRLWVWESPRADGPKTNIDTHFAEPMPYKRTGPGKARDGKPKFDLNKFDQRYFDRLKARVSQARKEGIYVSVMLFEGWSVRRFQKGREVFIYHPYHQDNNVNGIRGDKNGNGDGEELNALEDASITRLQEAYVRKMVETVGGLDNVLYEISNESHLPTRPGDPTPSSKDWQYHMIRFVHECEAGRPMRHPVGITGHGASDNAAMFASEAEWISPGVIKWGDMKDPWINDPPAADGRKVILLDTDHLNAPKYKADAGFSRRWVWKTFLRGMNPILMEWMDLLTDKSPGFEAAREAMGQTRLLAERNGLEGMTPRGELASTGFCLAKPGRAYLVYVAEAGPFTVDLEKGNYSCEGLDLTTGKSTGVGEIKAEGGKREFTARGEMVLMIKRVGEWLERWFEKRI